MNLNKLYQENKRTFWRYVAVSIFISGITVGMFVMLKELADLTYLGYFLSGFIGWTSKYFLNKYWVFKNG